jgi:hypothetical protein
MNMGFGTPPAPPAVTKHTELTDKEVAGVIDHADLSVTDEKLASGVGLSDGQICKLPTAVEDQFLRRGATAWEAGPAPVTPALYDVQSSDADLAHPGGAWVDLFTITRTLGETRKALIAGGFATRDVYAELRILVDDVAPVGQGRACRVISAGEVNFCSLETVHIAELAAGNHTIRLQAWADAATTIYYRNLIILWVA